MLLNMPLPTVRFDDSNDDRIPAPRRAEFQAVLRQAIETCRAGDRLIIAPHDYSYSHALVSGSSAVSEPCAPFVSSLTKVHAGAPTPAASGHAERWNSCDQRVGQGGYDWRILQHPDQDRCFVFHDLAVASWSRHTRYVTYP